MKYLKKKNKAKKIVFSANFPGRLGRTTNIPFHLLKIINRMKHFSPGNKQINRMGDYKNYKNQNLFLLIIITKKLTKNTLLFDKTKTNINILNNLYSSVSFVHHDFSLHVLCLCNTDLLCVCVIFVFYFF